MTILKPSKSWTAFLLSGMVAICVMCNGSSMAHAQEDLAKKFRNGWAYKDQPNVGSGQFSCNKPMGNGYGAPWVEYNANKKEEYKYVQIAKTPTYVLLFDSTRNATIILTDTAAYMMFPNYTAPSLHSKGKWVKVTY